MLENLNRKVRGLLSFAIIALIGLAFLMFGMSDYFSGSSQSDIAAKVDGEKISWNAVDTLLARLRRQFGEAPVDEATIRAQLRLSLVQKAALLAKAKSLGFRVGDVQIADTLLQIPVFQHEGKFSKERYLEVLGKAGYTDEGFREELAQNVLMAQLEQGLARSSFSSSLELERMVGLLHQKRDFGYSIIPQSKFKDIPSISAEELKSYFEGHQSQFVLSEQVSIEYVELSLDNILAAEKSSTIPEEELKTYYKDHLQSFLHQNG